MTRSMFQNTVSSSRRTVVVLQDVESWNWESPAAQMLLEDLKQPSVHVILVGQDPYSTPTTAHLLYQDEKVAIYPLSREIVTTIVTTKADRIGIGLEELAVRYELYMIARQRRGRSVTSAVPASSSTSTTTTTAPSPTLSATTTTTKSTKSTKSTKPKLWPDERTWWMTQLQLPTHQVDVSHHRSVFVNRLLEECQMNPHWCLVQLDFLWHTRKALPYIPNIPVRSTSSASASTSSYSPTTRSRTLHGAIATTAYEWIDGLLNRSKGQQPPTERDERNKGIQLLFDSYHAGCVELQDAATLMDTLSNCDVVEAVGWANETGAIRDVTFNVHVHAQSAFSRYRPTQKFVRPTRLHRAWQRQQATIKAEWERYQEEATNPSLRALQYELHQLLYVDPTFSSGSTIVEIRNQLAQRAEQPCLHAFVPSHLPDVETSLSTATTTTTTTNYQQKQKQQKQQHNKKFNGQQGKPYNKSSSSSAAPRGNYVANRQYGNKKH